jgi:hypothetical protein
VGELLEVLEFADGVGGEAFGVLGLDFDLLDRDEVRGVAAEGAQVDVGVGSLSEFLAWWGLAIVWGGGLGGDEGPLMYFAFSSIFNCSARSGAASGIGDAFPELFWAFAATKSLDLGLLPCSAPGGATISGDNAISAMCGL